MKLLFLNLSTAVVATSLLHPNKAHHLIRPQASHNSFHDNAVILAVTGECRPGELECTDGCMPLLAECCVNTDGYCKYGYHCDGDGCCEDGKICGGPPSRCTKGEVPCGLSRCMPKDAVCCSDGSHCRAGEVCSSDMKCRPGGGGDGAGGDGGGDGGDNGPPGGNDNPKCNDNEVVCGSACAPKGSTCCGTNEKICQPGWRCDATDGTCFPPDPGNGGNDEPPPSTTSRIQSTRKSVTSHVATSTSESTSGHHDTGMTIPILPSFTLGSTTEATTSSEAIATTSTGQSAPTENTTSAPTTPGISASLKVPRAALIIGALISFVAVMAL